MIHLKVWRKPRMNISVLIIWIPVTLTTGPQIPSQKCSLFIFSTNLVLQELQNVTPKKESESNSYWGFNLYEILWELVLLLGGVTMTTWQCGEDRWYRQYGAGAKHHRDERLRQWQWTPNVWSRMLWSSQDLAPYWHQSLCPHPSPCRILPSLCADSFTVIGTQIHGSLRRAGLAFLEASWRIFQARILRLSF